MTGGLFLGGRATQHGLQSVLLFASNIARNIDRISGRMSIIVVWLWVIIGNGWMDDLDFGMGIRSFLIPATVGIYNAGISGEQRYNPQSRTIYDLLFS